MDIVEQVSQQLFNLSLMGIVIFDRTGKVLAANDRLEEWLGYTPDEIVGKKLPELPFLSLKSKLVIAKKFVKRFTGSEVEPYLVDFKTKSGQVRVGRIEAKIVGEGEEKVDLAMISDVTDDAKSEEELIKLRLGLDATHDVIFITDIEGTIEYVNQAFEKVYGYGRQDWAGKTPRILRSGKQDDKWYEDFWKRLKDGQVVNELMINKTRDGSLLEVDAMVNPIIGADGEISGFLAVQRDVTEESQAQRELQLRTEELERINKLMVDRELKMVELKNRLSKLEGRGVIADNKVINKVEN